MDPQQNIHTLTFPHSTPVSGAHSNRSASSISPPISPPNQDPAYSPSLSSKKLAERRNTQASRYLTSQDFKSNFAIKLQTLRAKEQKQPKPHSASSSSSSNSPTYQPIPRRAAPTDTIDDLVPTPDTSKHHPSWPSTLSPAFDLPSDLSTSHPSRLQPLADPAITSERVPHPASIPARVEEQDEHVDDDEARYEVIGKLADQLAQQLELNDKLSYDLGILKTNLAELQSEAIDTADQLAVLKDKHIKLLLDGHHHHDAGFKDDYIQEVEAEVQSLQRAVCRLTLDLQSARSRPPQEPVKSSSSSLITKNRKPTTTLELNSNDSSRPTSLSFATDATPTTETELTSTTGPTTETTAARSSTTSNTSRHSDPCDIPLDDFQKTAKIASLERELAACEESRLVAETALRAFTSLMSPTTISAVTSSSFSSTTTTKTGATTAATAADTSISTTSAKSPSRTSFLWSGLNLLSRATSLPIASTPPPGPNPSTTAFYFPSSWSSSGAALRGASHGGAERVSVEGTTAADGGSGTGMVGGCSVGFRFSRLFGGDGGVLKEKEKDKRKEADARHSKILRAENNALSDQQQDSLGSGPIGSKKDSQDQIVSLVFSDNSIGKEVEEGLSRSMEIVEMSDGNQPIVNSEEKDEKNS